MNMANKRNQEPTLKLSHFTRDQLIMSLNKFSSILQSNQPIPADSKERLCKEIDEKMHLLTELSPFEIPQSGDASDQMVFEEKIRHELVVELTSDEILNVIGHLIKVKRAVRFETLATEEQKRKLVKENSSIIECFPKMSRKENNGRSDDANNDPDNSRLSSSSPKKQKGKWHSNLTIHQVTWFKWQS